MTERKIYRCKAPTGCGMQVFSKEYDDEHNKSKAVYGRRVFSKEHDDELNNENKAPVRGIEVCYNEKIQEILEEDNKTSLEQEYIYRIDETKEELEKLDNNIIDTKIQLDHQTARSQILTSQLMFLEKRLEEIICSKPIEYEDNFSDDYIRSKHIKKYNKEIINLENKIDNYREYEKELLLKLDIPTEYKTHEVQLLIDENSNNIDKLKKQIHLNEKLIDFFKTN